jgi:hypothetical protein
MIVLTRPSVTDKGSPVLPLASVIRPNPRALDAYCLDRFGEGRADHGWLALALQGVA